MPIVYEQINVGDKPKARYAWPAVYITPTEAIVEYLKKKRKEFILDQEYFLTSQKELPKKEDKRWASQEAKRYLRLVRAVNFMLPWFDGMSKETILEPSLWPVDLVEELDRVSNLIASGIDAPSKH